MTDQVPSLPKTRRESATSTSPPGGGGGDRSAGLLSKVGRALSPNRELGKGNPGMGDRRASLSGVMTDIESQRGRQHIVSTGRGGAGNWVRSPSRGGEPDLGDERGREIHRDASTDRAVHSGRGGAGNIRSPSRDPLSRTAVENETSLQERLIAEQRGRQADAPISTGRGGAGNFSRDKSRSRSAVRGAAADLPGPATNGTPGKEHHQVSGGRGGWGNIREERDSVDFEKACFNEAAAQRYESDIAAKHHAADAGKIHSSGRGGAGAGVTTKHLTPEEFAKLDLEEQEAHKKLHSTPKHVSGGRGGAGNYHANNNNLAVDGERGRDSGKGSNGIFGNVMRSLSRAKGTDRKD